MVRKPYDPAYHIRVYDKVVKASQDAPGQCEFRTDYPLYIASFMAVIPEFDFHSHDEYHTCNILYHRHHDSHYHQYQNSIHCSDPCHRDFAQIRNEIHAPQAETVQRQIRPRQESGIYPLVLRIAA